MYAQQMQYLLSSFCRSSAFVAFAHLLRIAASSDQGIFVAPNTSTLSLSTPTPCICTRNSVLILRADSDSFSLLDPHNASTSSINMILGLCSRARENKVLTNLKKDDVQTIYYLCEWCFRLK